MSDTDAARLARRRLLIAAIESGSFRFAVGCLVRFWSNFTTWACEEGGGPHLAESITMYTLAALTVAEIAGSLLGASRVEKLARRKRFVTAAGLATHGAWLVFGLLLLFLPRAWLVPAVFVLVAWRGFFDGFLIAPWFDLAARVAPREERARFFSVRMFSGTAALLLGGMLSKLLFWRFDGLPGVYWPLIFVAAGLFAMSADLARLAYPEPETPVPDAHRRQRLRAHLADYFRVVLRDARFRRFLAVSVVANLTIIYVPFVLGLFGKRRLDLSDSEYGSMMLLWQASPLVGCLLLPPCVRWLGWRRTYALLLAHLAAALGLMAAAALLPGTGGGAILALMRVAFVLLGLAGGWMFADVNVLYGIASEAKRPSYLVASRAASNAFGVALFIATGLAGAGGLPYGAIFAALAAAFLFASLFVLFVIRTREEEEEGA